MSETAVNDELFLMKADQAPRGAVEDYKAEHRRYGERKVHGSALLGALDYDAWRQRLRKHADGGTLSPDWVRSDTFFAVRKADGVLIGMADVRHTLGTPFLREYGGHIGYGVRPAERGKGYAPRILKLALAHAATIPLEWVMLGCLKDNEASRRTILRCGGILEREGTREDGKRVQIYRIALRPLKNLS